MEGWRQKKFIGRRRDGDYYTLLDGLPGVGKSCLLNPIVHWARYTRGRRRERKRERESRRRGKGDEGRRDKDAKLHKGYRGG